MIFNENWRYITYGTEIDRIVMFSANLLLVDDRYDAGFLWPSMYNCMYLRRWPEDWAPELLQKDIEEIHARRNHGK